MQWSNLTKCGLFFNIVSPAVHTLLPLVLELLDFRGVDPQKSPQVQIHCMTSSASQQSVFFSCWGTEYSQMVPKQENMDGDQPVQSHSHAQQPLQPQTCVQEHCPGEVGLPSSVFRSRNVSSATFSKSWITYPMWVYLKGNSAVSIRKGWKVACQVSLLWHNLLFSSPYCYTII